MHKFTNCPKLKIQLIVELDRIQLYRSLINKNIV